MLSLQVNAAVHLENLFISKIELLVNQKLENSLMYLFYFLFVLILKVLIF